MGSGEKVVGLAAPAQVKEQRDSRRGIQRAKAGSLRTRCEAEGGLGCRSGYGALLSLPSKLSFVALELVVPALPEGAFPKITLKHPASLTRCD